MDTLPPWTCDLLRVACYAEEAGGEVSELSVTFEQAYSLNCSLVGDDRGLDEETQALWGWRHESGTTFVSASGRWTTGATLEVSVPGHAQVFADVGGCLLDGPAVTLAPPETAFFAYLRWFSPSGVDLSTPDIDLHVLRTEDACWADPLDDLHFGSERQLNWGNPAEDADNPRRGRDARGPVGREFAASDAIASGESWQLYAHVRSVASSPVTVHAVVAGLGEVYTLLERTFDTPGYWFLGAVSQGGFTLADGLVPMPAECGPELCPDGTQAQPERCDGIDNDCDGETDETPETCLNETGNPDQSCVEVEGFFACLDF